MDDQFGGRTDDDLFFDDFEPVSDSQVVETVAIAAPPPAAPPAAVATHPAEAPKPEPVAPKTVEQPPPKQQPAAKRPPTAPRGGLANSRFADKPAAARVHPATQHPPPQHPLKSASPAPNPPQNAPTGPAAGTTTGSATPGANTALNAAARLGSGANPRTKLTESELAAKMEQMRILNAEKTRKFEQAEQDERSHAEAYARGMEAARQRRKLDEERRRRSEEERKRMDDERAKNRERKLKAMSMKEGGWDEGKDALAQEEEKRGFRGANGGVRGTRSGAGLSGSRFAREDDAGGDRYGGAGEDRRGGRGRGRGRGQGRGGRGGRGGEYERDHPAASNGAQETKPITAAAAKPAAPAPLISTDEFPALPGKTTSGDVSPPVLSPLGRWDDEMEAFDAKLKSAAAAGAAK
ncbi:hypothetical protein ColKHC_07582 [Colletotrichum higginsianum]|nr:hypothetical protein ColKHC_07582 [Colletotrichum higginsianum]